MNSIWEGSGNIMCLDVLRALQKNPRAMDVLAQELQADAVHLILGVQAALLLRHAPPYVTEVFCQSRLAHDWGYTYGSLGPTVHFSAILERAWPTRG